MTPVTCASGVELLMEYLDGALPADVASSLETHVLGCERCQAFVASYRETPRILREATESALPEDLRTSLDGFLRALRDGSLS